MKVRKRYASVEDIDLCRAIHRQHGTTYYYATSRFPASLKWRVHGLYAFVRIADEWIDNPHGLPKCEQRKLLEAWRSEFTEGVAGKVPVHPVMRVFCDAVVECNMPVEEVHCFLDAMIMDLDRDRYGSFDELRQYMRGSASAIGILMCYAMGVSVDSFTIDRAKALGEAMQLTNFLRDIREDSERGRIYLPQEDLARFKVSESDIAEHRNTSEFQELMKFEIARARNLYSISDIGIQKLPIRVRKAVLLARILYSQILNQIEEQEFDVFTRRARTNLPQKAAWATKVALASNQVLLNLIRSRSAA